MAKMGTHFVVTAFLLMAPLCLSTAVAQSFYDDEGVPDFEAPQDEEEAQPEEVEEVEPRAPRTRDEARDRERRRAEEEDQYYWGDPSPRGDDLGYVPFSEPFDLRVMNYQFWIGSGAIMAGSGLTIGAAVLIVFLPLFAGSQTNAPLAAGLIGIGVTISLIPPLVLSPMAINWVGNRYYPNQYLGAFLGSAAGLVLGFGLNLGALVLSEAVNIDAFTLLGAVSSIAIPAAGGVLGYQIQANSRANRRHDEGRRVELLPTPIVGSEQGRHHFGLGLSGRF